MPRPLISLALILATVLLSFGCAGTDQQQKRRTVDEIFAEGYEAYDDGDWNEALAKFDIIKLQYPTSKFAADAQFYIAEINYRRGEFVLAAFNYSVVRRSFPTSQRAKEATYQIAVCYEEMALPADRDQEYTKKAINAYTEFQNIYPQDSLALTALEKIRTLRDELAERYMIVAEHYEKTESRKAAIVYYDLVLDEYPDAKYYEEALVSKLRLQFAMARIEEARETIARYRRTVTDPTQSLLQDVDEMERNLP